MHCHRLQQPCSVRFILKSFATAVIADHSVENAEMFLCQTPGLWESLTLCQQMQTPSNTKQPYGWLVGWS